MSWQHIFIPVLPKHLMDMVQAPMPFLIGVLFPLMQRVRSHELGDAVILNADDGTIITPFDDVNSLPLEVKETLKKGLKKEPLLGDTVSRYYIRVTFKPYAYEFHCKISFLNCVTPSLGCLSDIYFDFLT